MVQVLVLGSFSHGGETYRRGAKPSFTEYTATQLAAKGLVKIIEPGDSPSMADGEKSSASPAALASPQTTASASDSGEASPAETAAEQPEQPEQPETPAEQAAQTEAPATDKAPKQGNRRGNRAAAAQ